MVKLGYCFFFLGFEEKETGGGVLKRDRGNQLKGIERGER
jgi:hypothetical protein